MDKQQLKEVLAYDNENVLSRFMDMFAVDQAEASYLFTETKKFLYLCQMPRVFIPDELLILDEMWHNFILFTKDYHAFCQKNFGRYFHHLPASKKEKELQRLKNETDPEAAQKEFEDKLAYLIACTYDHLGEETAIKWFRQYPERYSKENITKLRKY
ncbi:hypothetical protein LAG90_17600 [Marinilongibacter aquaticus]|uniref:hypothetical protein n=1 Tax=Marinilongibacter aquaticus TaxID=2975157 RepID=UPI0021BDEE06|nr:hypothetical protein [Marinilongibacter aquaticus]UBM58617.1 hypothetical protein LAG90_17600 [Marinilongibacter aquaticus]